jgi:hypothetical protein
VTPGQWKASLSGDEVTLYLVITAVLALLLGGAIFHYLRRARLIEDTPTSRIRSAAQGYVELHGAVIDGEAGELLSPLSNRPCVWFYYRVQRYRTSGKGGRWQTVRQGTSEPWFQINDDTATCLIDPAGAEVITEHSRTWYGHSEFPTETLGSTSLLSGAIGTQRYRYTEKFIHRHDVIYALGQLQTVGGGRRLPDSRQQTGEVIREWKQDYARLLARFDRNHDGQIDLQEWETVRQSAGREADQRRGALAALPSMQVLSKPAGRGYPYLLSTHSQKHLARRFRYFSAGALAGLLACAAFALGLLL